MNSPLVIRPAIMVEFTTAIEWGGAPETGSEKSMDVPTSNSEAVGFARHAGWKPDFETAQMVRGTGPEIHWNSVYGITSLELG